MSVAAMTAPSPGWYPDPDGKPLLRWWDGSAWTEFVTELPKAAAAPAAPPAAAPPAATPPTPAAAAPPAAAPATPAAATAPVTPAARRRRFALLGGWVAVVVAAVVAVVALTGGSEKPAAKRVASGAPAADRACLRLWNTTDSADAAALRGQVAAFRHGYGRLVRVKPLPGTLMQPGSCALELYAPDTDSHMILVAGVQGQLGYLDVTAYPRAATYGWPRTRRERNVRVDAQGVVHALR